MLADAGLAAQKRACASTTTAAGCIAGARAATGEMGFAGNGLPSSVLDTGSLIRNNGAMARRSRVVCQRVAQRSRCARLTGRSTGHAAGGQIAVGQPLSIAGRRAGQLRR